MIIVIISLDTLEDHLFLMYGDEVTEKVGHVLPDPSKIPKLILVLN